MKDWCIVKQQEKVIEFIDITNMHHKDLIQWQNQIGQKYIDSKNGSIHYSYTSEEEFKTIIECHNSDMVLLARIATNELSLNEQVGEFRRLREMYPKCSFGNSDWKPGLNYFETLSNEQKLEKIISVCHYYALEVEKLESDGEDENEPYNGFQDGRLGGLRDILNSLSKILKKNHG